MKICGIFLTYNIEIEQESILYISDIYTLRMCIATVWLREGSTVRHLHLYIAPAVLSWPLTKHQKIRTQRQFHAFTSSATEIPLLGALSKATLRADDHYGPCCPPATRGSHRCSFLSNCCRSSMCRDPYSGGTPSRSRHGASALRISLHNWCNGSSQPT